MAQVCLPDVSRPKIRPRCRCFSRRGREALPLRCAAIRALTRYVGPHHHVGGEFSSLYQNTFHHYRDFWCFDITTRSWDRIETKVRPSARSGHRFDFPCFGSVLSSFNKHFPEWHCGSITSFSSAGFTIQASPVSAPKIAHRFEMNVVQQNI